MKSKSKTPNNFVLRNLVVAFIAIGLVAFGYYWGQGQISLSLRHGLKPVATGLPDRLNYAQLNQLYKSIKDNYDGQVTEQQLIDGLKHGLASAANDPYTVYFTPSEAKQFENELNNSFAGIGARLSKDSDGNLIVGEAISGYPAQKAGLMAQDIITQIDGQDTSTMTLDGSITKIRGPVNSKVKLQVIRDKSQTLTFTITRQEIKVPSVSSKILDGNIGYLQITSFADDTSGLAKTAANNFKSAGVKGIILDLRDNPGGLLDAAVNVSSLWLPEGKTILQQKRGSTVEDTSYALGGNVLNGIPTVILINGGSASASEITAGALHDNKAAYIIGEKSYGKGVVQELVNFGDGSELKVTVASWYRPNGQNINKKGITPDKTIILTSDEVKANNDVQLKAAQEYLNTH